MSHYTPLYLSTASAAFRLWPPTVSLAQKVAKIRPADVWPVNNIGWDMVQGQLLLTLKHHATKVELALVPASPEMLASLALWWHVAARAVLPLEKDHLRVHDANHHWGSYAEHIMYFGNAMATIGESGRRGV